MLISCILSALFSGCGDDTRRSRCRDCRRDTLVDGWKLYQFLERNTNLWEFPCVWVYGETLEILNETVKGVQKLGMYELEVVFHLLFKNKLFKAQLAIN